MRRLLFLFSFLFVWAGLNAQVPYKVNGNLNVRGTVTTKDTLVIKDGKVKVYQTTGDTTIIKTAHKVRMDSLIAVGTIASGTWSATTIATTKGGTGLTSYTTGDIIYGSASNVLSKLAAGSNGQYLTLSGGIPAWGTVSSSNLGNSNLTSSSNARTFTLNGATSSNYLRFLNSTSTPLLNLGGDGIIQEGDATHPTKHYFYNDGSVDDNVVIFSGSNGWAYWQSQGRKQLLYGTTTGILQLDAQLGKMTATGTDGGFRAVNASSVAVATLETEVSGGWFFVANSSGTHKVEFFPPAGQYFMSEGCSFGYANGGAPAAMVDIQGVGTTTGVSFLQKNSSGTSFNKIYDNGRLIQNLASTVISDGDLINNSVNLYTDGTTLKARYKNNSGTASDMSFSASATGITYHEYMYATATALGSNVALPRVNSGTVSTSTLGYGIGVSNIDPYIIMNACTIDKIRINLVQASVAQGTVGASPTVRIDIYKHSNSGRTLVSTQRIVLLTTAGIGTTSTPGTSYQTALLSGLSISLAAGDVIGLEFVTESSDNNNINGVTNLSATIETVE